MITTTARILGTAYGYTRHAVSLIDWNEVSEIVLHGMKILIVMTLLAGRYTRRAWDSLLLFSERMGKAYARLLVGETPAPAPAKPVNLVVLLAADGMSQRAIAKQLGISRHAVKRQLAAV